MMTNDTAPDPSSAPSLVMIPVSELRPDQEQGRTHFEASALEGLARSLRESGVLEPLLVKRTDGPVKYQIVDGERRWRAAKLAGIVDLPCIVRDGPSSALDQLVANFQREDLNPVEKAAQLRRTMAETGTDAKDLAERAGLPYRMVLKLVRFAEGPELLRKSVSVGVRVTVDGEERTRRLDFEHALEALRLYTSMLEPADRSAHKRRALARLETLVRRALTEGWTCVRWRAQIATLAAERRGKGRRAAVESGEDAGAQPPLELPPLQPQPTPATTEIPALAAVPGDSSTGRGAMTPCSVPEILELLESVLGSAGTDELEGAAMRLQAAVARVSEVVEPEALFTCEGGHLVVFLDRLKRRPVDPYQRSALIKQAELVLAAARRAVEA